MVNVNVEADCLDVVDALKLLVGKSDIDSLAKLVFEAMDADGSTEDKKVEISKNAETGKWEVDSECESCECKDECEAEDENGAKPVVMLEYKDGEILIPYIHFPEDTDLDPSDLASKILSRLVYALSVIAVTVTDCDEDNARHLIRTLFRMSMNSVKRMCSYIDI